MTSRNIRVEGSCDADEVWDRYVRPRRWPEWSPQIRAVKTDDELLAPGSTGTVYGPARFRVRFTVLDVDGRSRVRAWSWRATAVAVTLTLHHTVEPLATGTRTSLTIEGPAVIVALYHPIARQALRRLVRPDRRDA